MNSRAGKPFYLLFLLALSACGPFAAKCADSPPSRYEGRLLAFAYPSGWKVEDLQIGGKEGLIWIDNPWLSSALISLHIDDPHSAASLREWLNEDLKKPVKAPGFDNWFLEYREARGKLTEVERTVFGRSRKGIQRDFSTEIRSIVPFYGSRSPTRAIYFLLNNGVYSLRLELQASLDEWPQAAQAFRMICASLAAKQPVAWEAR